MIVSLVAIGSPASRQSVKRFLNRLRVYSSRSLRRQTVHAYCAEYPWLNEDDEPVKDPLLQEANTEFATAVGDLLDTVTAALGVGADEVIPSILSEFYPVPSYTGANYNGFPHYQVTIYKNKES